jgi:hypothetical protein
MIQKNTREMALSRFVCAGAALGIAVLLAALALLRNSNDIRVPHGDRLQLPLLVPQPQQPQPPQQPQQLPPQQALAQATDEAQRLALLRPVDTRLAAAPISISHDGRQRSFHLRVPTSAIDAAADTSRGVPMVVFLHCFGCPCAGRPADPLEDWDTQAAQLGFVLVRPCGDIVGTLPSWNAGACCGEAKLQVNAHRAPIRAIAFNFLGPEFEIVKRNSFLRFQVNCQNAAPNKTSTVSYCDSPLMTLALWKPSPVTCSHSRLSLSLSAATR